MEAVSLSCDAVIQKKILKAVETEVTDSTPEALKTDRNMCFIH